MNKIMYFITGQNGEYSDWTIWVESIWDNEDNAKKELKRLEKNRDNDYDIEKIEVNTPDGVIVEE